MANEYKINTNILKDMDFQYMAEIEYDNDRPFSCDCGDDYHRCSQITNTRVESIHIDLIIDKLITKTKTSDFIKYCIYNILSHTLKLEYFEVDVVSGYYGEEIGSVLLEETVRQDLINAFEKLNSLKTDNEKLFYVLEREYGYVLDNLKQLDFKIIKTSVNQIIIPQMNHFMKLDRNRVDIYKKEIEEIPAVCVCREENGKLILVDGYHRLCAFKENYIGKQKDIKVIVGK